MEGSPFGRYRLLQLLGRGGMGEVWRAFDTETDRVVAVKVLLEEFANDTAYQQRFRREARAAAALNEPHVVPIHNFGDINGRLYVDMRLIQGQDLESILRRGPLNPGRAVAIVAQIASALHAAHRTGLIHRDVKPSNILVAADDFAYLIDFGIARAESDQGLTNTGTTIGTWAYMAPERFTSGIVDSRSDVYALACVLHQTLTGQQPYPGDSVEQQIAGHMAVPPPRPSLVRRDLPTDMDRVIASGMAKDPAQRYPTTTDLARAASAAITVPTRRVPPTRPAPAYTPPAYAPPAYVAGPTRPAPAPPAPWWRRPVPALSAAAGVLAVVIAVVVALVGFGGNESDVAAKVPDPPRATKARTSSQTTTTTRPPPNIDSLLLGAPELNAIMGATDMTVTKGGDGLLDDEELVDPPECRAAALIVGKVTFEGTPVLDSRYQVVSNIASAGGHSVFEHVVLAESASAAKSYFDAQARIWSGCQNRRVTTTNKLSGQSATYEYLGFTQGDRVISLVQTLNGWTCQRTLGVRGGYLADVSACAAGSVTDQAARAVTDILNRTDT